MTEPVILGMPKPSGQHEAISSLDARVLVYARGRPGTIRSAGYWESACGPKRP